MALRCVKLFFVDDNLKTFLIVLVPLVVVCGVSCRASQHDLLKYFPAGSLQMLCDSRGVGAMALNVLAPTHLLRHKLLHKSFDYPPQQTFRKSDVELEPLARQLCSNAFQGGGWCRCPGLPHGVSIRVFLPDPGAVTV